MTLWSRATNLPHSVDPMLHHPVPYPPYRECLSHFTPSWKLITLDRWMLELNSSGYNVPFNSSSPFLSFFRDPFHKQCLRQDVQSLLLLRASAQGEDLGFPGRCLPHSSASSAVISLSSNTFAPQSLEQAERREISGYPYSPHMATRQVWFLWL